MAAHNVTLRMFHDANRFFFTEKGLQTMWNRYDQIFRSLVTLGGGAGTELDTIDITNETVVASNPNAPNSGSFSTDNTSTKGEKVIPAAPGGEWTPQPPQSRREPRPGYKS